MIALPCPVCGAPVPPSKGVKPRKFCSLKCSQRASYESCLARGYKHPKTHRHVCVVCGDTFYSARADSRCCGRRCGNVLAVQKRHEADVHQAVKKVAKRKLSARQQMKARLAQRDADWAASPYAAPVTVDCVRTTDGRTLVIETRGQRCIGFGAVSSVKQS